MSLGEAKDKPMLVDWCYGIAAVQFLINPNTSLFQSHPVERMGIPYCVLPFLNAPFPILNPNDSLAYETPRITITMTIISIEHT